MLHEGKQAELASIIPFGTNVTTLQQQLREKIKTQQENLDRIHHQKLPSQTTHPFNWDLCLQKFLKQLGVARYGIARLNRDFSFTNSQLHPAEKAAIVVVVPMDYEKMQSVPSIESATEILNIYHHVGEIVLQLTQLIRSYGIQASGHHPLGDSSDYHHLLMPPHAVAAGLGEKGRTGLFIDHKLGPMVRLGMVTTSLDLEHGSPVDRGVNAFCHRCRYCVPHCPPRALPKDKYLESLELEMPIKFIIDGEKCIKYFANHYGCGKCIVKCVLTQPSEEELSKRLKRIEIWYNRWVKSGALLSLQNTRK